MEVIVFDLKLLPDLNFRSAALISGLGVQVPPLIIGVSSTPTIRYFNKCLEAVGAIQGRFLKQAPMELAPEITSNPLYYPYFKDCIGMIDGTHIDAMLPASLVARFRGRKSVTQNVLAACTPNKLFSYVLAGWEGSANDYRVLQDALSRPQPHGLRVYDGKYYLCDAGYTTMPGFISPYRGVRYHLNEYRGRPINNRRELFNLRHSSLRSKIESTFGLLKNRFKILTSKPHYPFPTQVDIVLACAILHNYIAIVDLGDDLLNEDITIDDDDVEIATEGEDANLVDFSQNVTQREERDSRNEWKEKRDDIASAMWIDYCNKYRGGDTTEFGL
ncbi:protein ALP1-like [Asparagus officinalis]|uniref:protein ALP1-like n=1 Tax=Asparagus officinalis TaxID=4686 RepID=UPI00098E15F9|nr:protein ALP1-like [Asparagus officinalis]